MVSCFFKTSVVAIICLAVVVVGFAQTPNPEKATTPEQFEALEREINAATPEEYASARMELTKRALVVAEEEITSADAELLLHWIVSRNVDSPVSHKAAQYLVDRHAQSPTSVRLLLTYAQVPNGSTPALFAGFSKSDQPTELEWIVTATAALHEKSLLLISDEMAHDKSTVDGFRMRLGEALTDRLSTEDLEEFESRVVSAFESLAERHGERSMGGMSIKDLSEGSIFALRHLRLGKTATGLQGETVEGKRIGLAESRGKVTLIDFWATWCAPCATAMPDLRALHEELDDAHFMILGVCGEGDKKEIQEFIKKQGMLWPNILDGNDRLRTRWQVLSLPTYFVLDKECVVRYQGDDHRAAAAMARSLLGVTPNGKDGPVPVAAIAKSILESVDANKDGMIQESEFPEQLKELLTSADQDKDGTVSADELLEFAKNAKVTSESAPPTPKQDDDNPAES